MVCDGAARKISSLITILSIIGWLVFVIGFGLRIHKFDKDDDSNLHIFSPLHEDAFPYWCFAIGAPLLFTSYFFHLCFNIKFTHYLSILFTGLYLVTGGGVLYFDGILLSSIYLDGSFGIKADTSDVYWVIVEFAGALMSIMFYWFSMMLWPCFKKAKAKGYYDY